MEAYRRHPVTLAQAFVTIDHLTRGRAILGIGNGERENVEPYGMAFTKRVGRLEESLEGVAQFVPEAITAAFNRPR